MPEQWYSSRNGQRFGPFSANQLRQMAAEKQLLPSDHVWKEGLAGWVAAATLRGLFPQDTQDPQTTGRRGPPPLPPPPPPPPAPAAGADDLDYVPTQRGARPGSAADLDNWRTQQGRSAEARPVFLPEVDPPAAMPAAQPTPSGGELKVGHLLDKFLITKTLGRGGMGVVYKAIDQETEVEYAVKVLTPQLIRDPAALADLKKEVANAQTLTHQNLLKVNYLATAGPIAYVVMEHIDGENLEEFRLRKGGTVSLDDFRKLAPQILAGLDYLHEKGVVHLDVKPHNIMRTRQGEVKIADYGIARSIKEQLLRQKGQDAPAGTLCYMPAEQLHGADVLDRRTDVYAVGMLFHYLLTGRYPFDPRDSEGIVRWHLDEKHQIANLGHAALNGIVRRALATNPASRHNSTGVMLQELIRAGLVEGMGPAMPPVAVAAPVPAVVDPELDKIVELADLVVARILKKTVWQIVFDANFAKVVKTSDGRYMLPNKSGLRKFTQAFTEKFDPVEEISYYLVRHKDTYVPAPLQAALRTLVDAAQTTLAAAPAAGLLYGMVALCIVLAPCTLGQSVWAGMWAKSHILRRKLCTRLIANFGQYGSAPVDVAPLPGQ